jgi:polyisoprenoid-binding protein YceI
MDKNAEQPEAWKLDKTHSEISFRIRHMMISWISGSFEDFDGEISFDGKEQFSAGIRILVDSISTGNKDRDQHLKSIDFFNAGLYPEIHFRTEKFLKTPEEKWKLSGELTIHGHSRLVELDMEISGTGLDPWGNERAGFSFSGRINRRDFGISWNSGLQNGGLLIGEEVEIRAELQMVRKLDHL